MIEVFKTLEELDALKENWNEVFCKSSTATPYQDWQFVKTTWEIWHKQGDRLYIICYKQKDTKQYDAILPCYINKDGALHLMDYMTDFCDGVIPDSLLESYDMYYEIIQSIEKDKNIRSVCFNCMRQDSRLMAYLYGLGTCTFTKSCNGYTIVRMAYNEKNKDFADSIVGCKNKQRKKLRKMHKANEVRLFRVLQAGEPYPEKEIRELGDFMVAKGMRTRTYLNDNFFTYFKELYQKGLLVVMLMYEDDVLCACKFMLTDLHSHELVSWVLLCRESKYNSGLTLCILDYMYQNGIYNLNFARGVYPYKISNFHPNVYVLNCLRIYKSQKDAKKDMIKDFWERAIGFILRILPVKI